MSEIRLNLTDHDQTISGEVHGSIGDAVIAALSAEPETIHELAVALARFVKPIGKYSSIGSLHAGENFEPYDAGIVIVDLAARVVAIDSTYSEPQPIDDDGTSAEFWQSPSEANDEPDSYDLKIPEDYLERNRPLTYQISYHDGEQRTDLHLPYRLPDDWLLVGTVPEYEGLCHERRAERLAGEPFDARAVLFGKQLSEFLAIEILSAVDLDAENLFAEIHARWLVTPRADLGGRSPRDILLASKEFIDFDLQSRELQWSFTGECPPPLARTARAYRFGGFGTHEIVLYYDLIRALLDLCCDRARALKGFSLMDEVARLESLKNAWLEMPQGDSHGKSAALIIDLERQRIPLAISGKEAMVDEDCPVCQAMAQDSTPYFWHLDGCNMDDQFEFSFFQTRAEWDADRLRQEAFHQEMDREWQEREATMVNDFGAHLLIDEAEPC
jgi:hypothetical protein